MQNKMEANFSSLVISIASSALMNLGLAENPITKKLEKDLNLARFNIDLIEILQQKTKGNLSTEENQLINSILNDLRAKYLAQAK